MFKLFNKDKEINDIKLSLCRLMCNTDNTEEICKLIDIYNAINSVSKGDNNVI